MPKPPTTPPSDGDSDKKSPTHARRRTLYGVNVAIAIIAAAALAIFINWIVHREYEQVPIGVKNWVSYDLTATGRYSLSAQTKQVLAGLKKNYTIVTLFSPSRLVVDAAQLRAVSDMVDNYQRYSDHLTVQHINPDLEVVKVQKFYKQVLKRYADKLKPMREAVAQGKQAIKDVRDGLPKMIAPLQKAIKDPTLTDDKLKQFIQQVAALLAQKENELKGTTKQVDKLTAQPLPAYGQVKTAIESLLNQLGQGLLAPVMQHFNDAANQSTGSPSVKNDLLTSVAAMGNTEQGIAAALAKLKAVQNVSTYDDVRSNLLSTQAVVVLGPSQVRLIPVSQMYRAPTPEQVRQAGNHDQLFLGEAKLTGALVSLTLKHPPMVIFVNQGQTPALGPRGEYQAVASRLQAANIDVEQWNPNGRATPFGRRMPARPAPTPGPGQHAIWIILPAPPSNPMRMQGANGAKKVVDLLKDRLAQGDSAMILLGANPAAQFGQPNPLVGLLKNNWGITPQLDRVIMQERQQPGAPPQANMQILITDWPNNISIDKALNGLPGIMLESSPLVLGQPKKGKVQQWPLVKIQGQRLWTITDFSSQKAIHDARYDKTQSKPSYTVGVAAEKDGKRLVVVADPVWASDTIVQYGTLGPGTAPLTGAQFPGNGDLFVNCVYWLGGLNQLIASSPQAQDIRRIQPMTAGAITGYRVFLLAGLPILTLAIGLGVWTMRRRE